MNLDEWDNVVVIGTMIWFVWFVIEFLSLDYDLFCFSPLENSSICFTEPIWEISKYVEPWAERISMMILGFFVFDLGFRCGKMGWKQYLHSKQNIFDIVITIPFFWLFGPLEIMRTMRMLRILKLVLKFYQAIKKSTRLMK